MNRTINMGIDKKPSKKLGTSDGYMPKRGSATWRYKIREAKKVTDTAQALPIRNEKSINEKLKNLQKNDSQ